MPTAPRLRHGLDMAWPKLPLGHRQPQCIRYIAFSQLRHLPEAAQLPHAHHALYWQITACIWQRIAHARCRTDLSRVCEMVHVAQHAASISHGMAVMHRGRLRQFQLLGSYEVTPYEVMNPHQLHAVQLHVGAPRTARQHTPLTETLCMVRVAATCRCCCQLV